jgi:hypothetical protein
MHGYVNHEFFHDLRRSIYKVVVFVFCITSKEIHMASIPWWRQEITEIVCMFEKELALSIMDFASSSSDSPS